LTSGTDTEEEALAEYLRVVKNCEKAQETVVTDVSLAETPVVTAKPIQVRRKDTGSRKHLFPVTPKPCKRSREEEEELEKERHQDGYHLEDLRDYEETIKIKQRKQDLQNVDHYSIRQPESQEEEESEALGEPSKTPRGRRQQYSGRSIPELMEAVTELKNPASEILMELVCRKFADQAKKQSTDVSR